MKAGTGTCSTGRLSILFLCILCILHALVYLPDFRLMHTVKRHGLFIREGHPSFRDLSEERSTKGNLRGRAARNTCITDKTIAF